MSSLLDILPAEAQHFLGLFGMCAIAAGLVMWAAGLKTARFSVAVFLGIVGAFLGAWQLARDIHVTPITGALLGFVIGSLVGAIAFRLLQSIVLACCITLATAGLFYHYQIN